MFSLLNLPPILLTTGVVTSPNYPDNYPHNLDKTETIQVESGKLLRIEFTQFNVVGVFTLYGVVGTCVDFVKIIDGDGTTLLDDSCGTSVPPIISSRSNRVKIFFHTNGWTNRYTAAGWSLSWSAVTPGVHTGLGGDAPKNKQDYFEILPLNSEIPKKACIFWGAPLLPFFLLSCFTFSFLSCFHHLHCQQ